MDNSASRILLVDDEPALLKMVERIPGPSRLRRDDCEQHGKGLGGNGSRAATAELSAVAVLDGTMPGLSMIELGASAC